MNLKKLRQEHNLTQEDIAKILNKSSVAYSYYESGRNEPDLKTILTLAELYQTTTDAILGHEVPYLLDKSTLTPEQREIIEIIPEMNYEECKLMLAYLAGIRKGIEERNTRFKFEEEKYEQ